MPAPPELWPAWNIEPAIWIPLSVSVLLYLLGLQSVWRRAGLGHGIPTQSCLRFLGALLALTVALLSPLDALSESLLWAHMTQHMTLILIAAPLLVLSDLPLAIFWSLPRPWAQTLARYWNRSLGLGRLWRMISHPATAWLLFALGLWFWHVPVVYETALRNETMHSWEHILFLSIAMLFWRVLFKQMTPSHLLSGAAIPYLFTTILHSGILGALMTFSSQPWYAYYVERGQPWGLTPLADQQLAGLIMWLPGGMFFSLILILYFGAWLLHLEKRVQGPHSNLVHEGERHE
jgi:putative membrane protein